MLLHLVGEHLLCCVLGSLLLSESVQRQTQLRSRQDAAVRALLQHLQRPQTYNVVTSSGPYLVRTCWIWRSCCVLRLLYVDAASLVATENIITIMTSSRKQTSQ